MVSLVLFKKIDMPNLKNIIALIHLGLIDPRLMQLSWNLRRTRRTYLSFAALNSLAENFLSLNEHATQPLEVAEFGVGRGGSAMLLAWLVNKYHGQLYLFDVFSRIPAPTEQDGEQAKTRYETIMSQESGEYYGNVPDLLVIVTSEIYKICKPNSVEFVQGKYEEVLPKLGDQYKFSLVHIDCDWYESSVAVYKYLQNRLSPGAVIQVDDDSHWEGSRRAYQAAKWLKRYSTHLVEGALVIDTSAPG